MKVKADSVEAMLILVTAAETGWGKGKVAQLMAQLVDMSEADKDARAHAYREVRNAISQLPLALWPQDKLSARRELLDELSRQITLLQDRMSNHPTLAELREQEWRATLAGSMRRAHAPGT
ncbi:hypothetical protein [Herbaspirillum sp. alder98]|uniref:hypothetical protein n=1 Tax=Herbaspirillum sp. alder98 TaxID=2913096 RepID=UPI001CD849C8|nr:hypothetical protein [Herbaspirillum sp. alder98]MCA1325671.1 hypothetical protein [Herbaspirillum sp. alder98]